MARVNYRAISKRYGSIAGIMMMASVSGKRRVRWSVLQCVEGEERETQVLQCVAVYFRRAEMCALQGVAVCCGVLQCVAVCC